MDKLTPAQKRSRTILRKAGFVFRAATVTAPAALPALGKIQCVEPTCYKFEHKFSQVGAFGDGIKKGHFDLNPTHGWTRV